MPRVILLPVAATVAAALSGAPALGSRTPGTRASLKGHDSAAHVARTRRRVRSATYVLAVPAPSEAVTYHKNIRVHRRLRASEWRRLRVRQFQAGLRVRRTDGEWSDPVAPGHRTVLADPDGRPLVQLFYGLEYHPRPGILRFGIAIRNAGVPREIYRRSRVTIRLIARYRF